MRVKINYSYPSLAFRSMSMKWQSIVRRTEEYDQIFLSHLIAKVNDEFRSFLSPVSLDQLTWTDTYAWIDWSSSPLRYLADVVHAYVLHIIYTICRSVGLYSNNRLSAHTIFLFNRKSSFDDCIFRLVRSIAFLSHYSTFSDLRLFSVHNVWMYVRTSLFSPFSSSSSFLSSYSFIFFVFVRVYGDEDDVTLIFLFFPFLLCLGDCCFLTDEWLNRTAEFEASQSSFSFSST